MATIYKAFVSSTFEDLKDHREHVIRALRRAGFFVDPMEDWPADSDEPKQFSQDRLNGCALCVLLVALRRGYVPEGETRSITQLEYDAAVKQGIDILPFLLDENAAWPRKFDELDKDSELKPWRDSLGKRHGREVFTLDPRSIDMTGALGRWFAKKNAGVYSELDNRLKKLERKTKPFLGIDGEPTFDPGNPEKLVGHGLDEGYWQSYKVAVHSIGGESIHGVEIAITAIDPLPREFKGHIPYYLFFDGNLRSTTVSGIPKTVVVARYFQRGFAKGYFIELGGKEVWCKESLSVQLKVTGSEANGDSQWFTLSLNRLKPLPNEPEVYVFKMVQDLSAR